MSSQPQSATRASVVMFLYSALMLSLGILAYLIAPPGANAKTAVIVTGACAFIMLAMGVMSMMIHKKRKVGMIGIHLGLILPLIFATLFLMRAGTNYRASGVHRYFQTAYLAEVKAGTFKDTPDDRTAFLTGARPKAAGEIPDGDKGYLGFILTMLFGVSVAAFVVLLLSRPEIPPKAAPIVTTTPPQPKSEASLDSRSSGNF